jgi:ABC-type uncharacterized transport system ATPase component
MSVKSILSAAVLSGLALSAFSGATRASEIKSFKPLEGLTFAAGDKHAVGYFTNETGKCKLVVTLAGQADLDSGSFEITRYEISVPAGNSRRYENTGHAYQFSCAMDAQTMTFQALTTIAGETK